MYSSYESRQARSIKRRVALTGIGVVAPGIPGTEAFWSLVSAGKSAVRTITQIDPSPFRSQIAGECDFNTYNNSLTTEERETDRSIQFALVCAMEAISDAWPGSQGKLPGNRKVGIAQGTAIGGSLRMVDLFEHFTSSGEQWNVPIGPLDRKLFDDLLPSQLGTSMARKFGATGPVSIYSSGCTSGLDAVGQGAAMIRQGRADIVLAGGTDAPISPITVACFDAIKATSPSNDMPTEASRPFDKDRNGFVLAEGAACLVLEEWNSAVARGATIYAEIAGYAVKTNGYHMTGLTNDGTELADAILEALGESKIPFDGIDYINAHGSSTYQNDIHETAAIKKVFKDAAFDIPISSIKSMIGHSLGAVGAIEIAACALAIRHKLVPPTANLDIADPECDLDYVPGKAKRVDVRNVLSTASGFGGFQSAIVLTDGNLRNEVVSA